MSLRLLRYSDLGRSTHNTSRRFLSLHRLLLAPLNRTSTQYFASIALSKKADVSPYASSRVVAGLDAAEAEIDRNSPFNEAANLAQQLQVYRRAGLNTWGFVVYRCTYASDSAWQQFLEVLNARVRDSLRAYSHPDLYHTLSWTIQSDFQVLGGASKDVVREHFKGWVEREITDMQVDPGDLNVRHFPRFRYCLHVDDEVLKSVVWDAPQPPSPDLRGVGYVNFIAKDWDQEIAQQDGEDEEEIDGKRTDDVGWMKVAVAGLAPRTYQLLNSGGTLYGDCYQRPPAIAMP